MADKKGDAKTAGADDIMSTGIVVALVARSHHLGWMRPASDRSFK